MCRSNMVVPPIPQGDEQRKAILRCRLVDFHLSRQPAISGRRSTSMKQCRGLNSQTSVLGTSISSASITTSTPRTASSHDISLCCPITEMMLRARSRCYFWVEPTEGSSLLICKAAVVCLPPSVVVFWKIIEKEAADLSSSIKKLYTFGQPHRKFPTRAY